MDRMEWFVYFLNAARAPVPSRPSGPAVDRAEWLSVFLAAATASPPSLEGVQSDAVSESVLSSGEERARGKSVGRQQAIEDDGGVPETRPKARGEEHGHTQGDQG